MFNSSAKIFRYFLICFILGVFFASFFWFDDFVLYFLNLIFLVLMIIFWQNKLFRYLSFGGIILILGIWCYQASLPKTDPTKIWFYNNSKVNFTGVVTEPPDVRINQQKLTVVVRQLNTDHDSRQVFGKVLINANLYPQYEYGDLLEIDCELKKPGKIDEFAYDRYLALSRIYTYCSYPKIKLLNHNEGIMILSGIFRIKSKLIETINSNLPEPQASLFVAIILGSRRGIPADLNDKFNLTGTTHLVAISGLNITIIAAILMSVCLNFYLSRKKSFWVISIFLIFYLIIIGWPASAVRAGIMGWLAILAIYFGRLNRLINALILAGVAMILINPLILRDDVGFQLSFLAVLGMIYFVPFFEKIFKLSIFNRVIKEAIAVTLAAQAATLPLLIYYFGRVSIIAPLTNLLIVSILPFLTIYGFIVLSINLIFFSLSAYFFWPIWLILSYIIKVIEIFATLPLASVWFK
ncbi:MAG: hypothetical protein A2729_06130 [Candidatus Buchananbacteria bacterium RIFCSPHIGHO2_01_FULL_39_14]|uniref:ComEC/Rec2-related protein domain-containing protein n=2 Tax=Candidatus Buchananiibacteriota TaxID=1817903 RepID=A0A1G1YM39_9BACT|nr:MAG: hypothetical protein A2729_06130 [Candidatus Buchananbacteria bacterium RIFCSPHIGHO2_01_FULL_39_14]OGY49355.1 MAG: hypothetical protein A3D39_04240 [Candidatus Buchananbacteria bacterium RIFCSPHIGHO2_02_FULL_39_17]OGY53351.1 MAG: hypothetical protein A2912_05300 [Candidatus Buchananbacteria bacterium RIFCSPLOWO2_01_FULL_40_23b]